SYEVYFSVFFLTKSDRDLAQDLTQETFLRAYQSRATFVAGRPMLPWLKAIARNLYRNQFRTPRIEHSSDTMSLNALFLLEPWSSQSSVIDPVGEGLQRLELVQEAFSLVTKRFRPSVRLHLHGWSNQEIADKLFMTKESVESYVSKGMTQLRQAYRSLLV